MVLVQTLTILIFMSLGFSVTRAAAANQCNDSLKKNVEQLSWPADGPTIDYSGYVPYAKALMHYEVTLKRINKTRNVRWTGPSKPEVPYTGDSRTYEARLSAYELRDRLESQNREALVEFIDVAFSVGKEQGRREIRAAKITPVIKLTEKAKAFAATGNYTAAAREINRAISVLKDEARSNFPRAPMVLVNGKSEWSNDLPTNRKELVPGLQSAFEQLYSTSGKPGTNTSKQLSERILSIISDGAVLARKEAELGRIHDAKLSLKLGKYILEDLNTLDPEQISILLNKQIEQAIFILQSSG
ncbi:MAG: hypothetical protein V4736_03935 [Bdellovibrionota bacterium]